MIVLFVKEVLQAYSVAEAWSILILIPLSAQVAELPASVHYVMELFGPYQLSWN